MDGNARLLLLLERVLGPSRKSGKSNYAFNCPRCNHRKPKLEINVENQYYHCWVCDTELKGKTIKSLFRKLGVGNDAVAELASINRASGFKDDAPQASAQKDAPIIVALPPEARPLWVPDGTREQWKALAYLKGPKRNLTDDDIARYRMHYCASGKYRGMVIIPSYDESGAMNYFFARSYTNDFKLNPPGSRDVILFESNINWSLPVTLVEGMFDAIACKRNALPLGGKTILSKLRARLRERRVADVYVALDEDARKDQLELTKQLIRDGHTVHWVDTSSGDPSRRGDPDNLGYREMRRRLTEARVVGLRDLMQLNLE
ncbi:MAG: hypothetical protein WC277_08580 [Bacilli bacterium]